MNCQLKHKQLNRLAHAMGAHNFTDLQLVVFRWILPAAVVIFLYLFFLSYK